MEISTLMFALLRYEIKGTELSEDVKNLIDEKKLKELYKLSKRHDLAHLIADALKKNGVFSQTTEAEKRFAQERNLAIFRVEQIQYEFEIICQTLEEEKIPFLPLKGAKMREFYPETWMRTSCDIDILVQQEDLEKAKNCLKRKLSYEMGEQCSHDVSFFAPSGIHLELHFSLVESDSLWKEILIGVWEKRADGKEYQYEMSNEFFYLYHLIHMGIHMRTGGCGVRTLLDFYILNKKMEFDEEKTERLLENAKLLKFENAVRKLADCWFDEKEKDALTCALEEYILLGGVYGTTSNRIAVQQSKKGGKAAYLFSRVFVSYKELSIKYPSLEKNKWLFPFYQIYRWFDLFFHKESRERVEKEIHHTYEIKEETIANTEQLFHKLDL